MKVIGISGIARSGKDLCCEIIIDQCKKVGLVAKRFALADEIKRDCENFLRQKCSLDVWTSDSFQKAKFRDFLVWYGNLKRKESQGKYWTSLLENELVNAEYIDEIDVAIITDIRYDEYPEDEIQWIKTRMGGKLIHVSKYSLVNPSSVPNSEKIKSYIVPPNEHERVNDPKMKAGADFCIDWEHKYVDVYDVLIEDPYLVAKVYEALGSIKFYE